MSNTRYIEIDSSYRNRNEWPNPSEFEIIISQTGRKDMHNSQDPVSLATPIGISWSPSTFNIAPSQKIVATIKNVDVENASDQKTIIKVVNDSSPSANVFNNIDGYYNGIVLKNDTQSTAGNTIASRISSFVWLGKINASTDAYQITVDGAIKFTDLDTISISDSTSISLTDYYYFFVPNGRPGFNAYPGCILYNETHNSYENILGYDSVTKLVKVKKNINWSLSHTFSIRKQAPIKINSIENTNYSKSVFSLPDTFSDQQNTYQNSYIKIEKEVRKIIRYETFSGKAIGGSTTTVLFPNNASNINGFYNNAYIKRGTDVKRIISYTVTGIEPNLTKTATIDGFFSPAVLAGDDFTFRSVFVSPAFDFEIKTPPFELLLFSHDNHNPFVYTGSMVSQQEAVCYQIELMDLIVPNKILNCGFGSRIAFYPYLYVELTNISGANVGMKNTIYSNNPNATSMIFRVPIYDVQNPIASAFVKLDGDGMVQTVKFKPNESIFFSVHLPNGELFKVLDQEQYGPYTPNPDIQISALFSFKRV
jgi:hypothetical protein